MAAYAAADNYHCGLFGLAAGETADARKHFQTAAAALTDTESPLSKEIHFHLGQLQLMEGALADARTSLTRSREIAQTVGDDPRAARALQVLGMVAEKEGDLDKAREIYREAIEEMGTPALQKERDAIRKHLGEIEGKG